MRDCFHHQRLFDLIQRTVGPAIPIDVVSAPGLWAALVDPSQLENGMAVLTRPFAIETMADRIRSMIEASREAC